jgi:hypothetical protein
MNKAILLAGVCLLLFPRLAGADDAFGNGYGSTGGTSGGAGSTTNGTTSGGGGAQTPSVNTDQGGTYVSQAPDGLLTLRGGNCTPVEGTQIQVGEDGTIYHWVDISDSVKWRVKIDKPGVFYVVFNYAMPQDCNGSVVVLSAGGLQLTYTPPPTQDWGNYQRKIAGQATIKTAGLQEIDLIATQKPGAGVMNLRSISLIPANTSPVRDPKAATAPVTPDQAQAYVMQDADGSLLLSAEKADLEGALLQAVGDVPVIAFWTDASESIKWMVKVDKPGVYHVSFNYALAQSGEGSMVVFSIGGQQVTFAPDPTSGWNDLQEKDAGQVTIKETGLMECSLVATEKPGDGVLNLRSITLSPVAGSNQSAQATPTAQPDASSRLTPDQAKAVVVIMGDNAEGTGFLVQTADGPAVVTNLHVISDNPNLKIMTSTGKQVTVLSLKGASDRDLAMFAIKDDHYSYLKVAANISSTAQPGDEVITPGNSEGGEVVLNTTGKILGIGPDRIEFDNPVYHGNSGGPVFHTKSGQVLAVVTEGVKVDLEDELDKTSFANRNSAITQSMRYFGLRLDNVPQWEPYDLKQFQAETAFLDRVDKRSRCLDSYLNTPDDGKPESKLYLEDEKIVKANSNYFDQANDGDASQKVDALREWLADLQSIAGTDMDTLQDLHNFYTFEQQRAKDEIGYRNALKNELEEIGKDVSRMSALPRSR